MRYFNGKKVAALYHHGRKVMQQYNRGKLVYNAEQFPIVFAQEFASEFE